MTRKPPFSTDCRKNDDDFLPGIATVEAGISWEGTDPGGDGSQAPHEGHRFLGSETTMKLLSVLGLSAAAIIAASSIASAALNTDRANYFKAGKHQVYVWCTGGAADTSVSVDASSGEDAIKKAVAGKPNCWGVWQGLNG